MSDKNSRLIQALISIYMEDLEQMELQDLGSTPDQPLSIPQDYFEEIIRLKGWTIKDVACFFGVQERQMRNIINNDDRKNIYNYALLGIPSKNKVL